MCHLAVTTYYLLLISTIITLGHHGAVNLRSAQWRAGLQSRVAHRGAFGSGEIVVAQVPSHRRLQRTHGLNGRILCGWLR